MLYCDGATGWEILPGTQQVVELTGGELEFARRYVEGFRLNTWIADRDPRYRITSPSPNVVRISDGDITHQLDITVDAASSLPVKISTITLSDPAHPIPSAELTTEWETVQGIRFPRRWTVFRSGVRVADAIIGPGQFEVFDHLQIFFIRPAGRGEIVANKAAGGADVEYPTLQIA